MFYLGGGDLRKYQWRSETGRRKQLVQCVIKQLNTAGNGNSGASIEYMPQKYTGGTRALGTPTRNSVARPTLGLSQGAKVDVEAKEDLQAKKCWCWQLEARHVCP